MFDLGLLGWLGLGGGTLAACAAVAWFFPPFRRLAIMVGGAVAALMFAYMKGRREGSARKQKEWNDAINRDVSKGEQARADAERAIDADPDGMQHDKWNRDKS